MEPAATARLILHVEAGPSFGGSTLALQNYLVNADGALFGHDVLFYSEVPGSDQIRARSRRFLCLGCSAPKDWDQAPAEAPARSLRRPRWREAIKRVPGVRPLVRQLRASVLFLHRELPLALRIARLMRRHRYDLVHCNNTFLVQRAVLLAARLTSTPAIAHARTRVTIGAFDRRLGNGARRIFAVSQSLAEDLSRQGVHAPITVCYEGTPIDDPEPAAELGIGGASTPGAPDTRRRDGGRVLGFAGRLVERKGVRHLLEAMPRLLARCPDARLEIVGDGPMRGELEALCSHHTLQHAVSFLGFRSDVYTWLRTIDVFVLPSLTEGLPLVLLEAMAASRPVVACSVDGVPEFIRHGETGLLVPPASASALEAALARLLQDPALAARLGGAARAFVEAHGDLRVTARRLDEAFRDALELRL